MEILLENISKSFGKQQVIQDLSLHIQPGERWAILGANGSGKSTLLQVLAGFQTPNSGKISWKKEEKKLDPEILFTHLSWAGPYMELIEEFTLEEFFRFHASFKPFGQGIRVTDAIEISGLGASSRKTLRDFSSGMKQRVRLTQAILSDTDLLLLDEPCSNLDQMASQWFRTALEKFISNRTLIIASNEQEDETFLCKREHRFHR